MFSSRLVSVSFLPLRVFFVREFTFRPLVTSHGSEGCLGLRECVGGSVRGLIKERSNYHRALACLRPTATRPRIFHLRLCRGEDGDDVFGPCVTYRQIDRCRGDRDHVYGGEEDLFLTVERFFRRFLVVGRCGLPTVTTLKEE